MTTTDDRPIYQLCEWYALCMNAAVGTSKHPILGDVPICSRCAIKHELKVDVWHTPDEWSEIKGLYIMDPDGWRSKGDPDWFQPITESDFDDRASRSTTGPRH